jgi:hypothetical protein
VQCRHPGSKVPKRPTGLSQSIYLESKSVMPRPRIRRCVECPKCLTRYLIAFSPYRNGSYLMPTIIGCSDEYTLHCSCSKPSVASRWIWSEIKIYAVTKSAHSRGYGTAKEIVLESYLGKAAWSFDITRYLHLRPIEKEAIRHEGKTLSPAEPVLQTRQNS